MSECFERSLLAAHKCRSALDFSKLTERYRYWPTFSETLNEKNWQNKLQTSAQLWDVITNNYPLVFHKTCRLVTARFVPLSSKIWVWNTYIPSLCQNCFLLIKKTLGFQLHKIALVVLKTMKSFSNLCVGLWAGITKHLTQVVCSIVSVIINETIARYIPYFQGRI